MVKKLLLLLLASGSLSAEGMDHVYEYGHFKEGARVYLFADKVRIRKEPLIARDNIIAHLPIGHPLTVLKRTEKTHTAHHFTADWVQVSFLPPGAAGPSRQGYVWGGLLALAALPEKKGAADALILTGIKSFSEADGFSGEVRLVRKNRIISTIQFRPPHLGLERGAYGYTVSAALADNRGLKGIEGFLILTFIYEACGYPNGDLFFPLRGRKIYKQMEALMVSEAGVFHSEAKLIFPDQKDGRANRLVRTETTENFDEKINDYRVTRRERTIYYWAGERFIRAE